MKIVADQASIKPGYGYSSLMVRKDHVVSGRYKTFADLKGMKVAIGAPGTGTASALNEALKKGGLKYGDVDVVYLGFPEHLPAYKNKGIDASITNEPTMTRAIEDGVAVRVAGNDVTYPDQQTAVTFFSDHFISSRRDAAERFMRAYLRGVRMYNDALRDGRLAGPKANEVIAILVKYTTIKDESMFRRMVPSYCNPDGEVNVASLRKDLEFFRELGLIEKKDVNVDGVVDASFAKAFPRTAGYRVFLIRTPAGQEEDVGRVLERAFRSNGLIATPTRDKVAAYQAVIGAYLSTFQLLGGLGLLLGVLGLAVVVLRAVWERVGELALLRAVRPGDGALTLAELANRTGLNKSTILRLAVSLQRANLLVKLPVGGFRLGGQLLSLAAIFRESLHLDREVRPRLVELLERLVQ